ncbi:MAG: ABC transporter permease, partial [Chloroflexi bacterium]|nr:ABC transporter permease [Chloroflexota bacterium]
SVQNVIIVITVVSVPRMVRVVRSSVLSLREQQFVEAARALGVPAWRILALHIAPNTLAPVMVQGTFIFALAVITEANLSFLGAGVPPTTPSWGNIMGQGRTYLQIAVWVTFFPGVFLSLTVLSINLLGDGLRDALDPKLRRRA